MALWRYLYNSRPHICDANVLQLNVNPPQAIQAAELALPQVW